MKQLPKYTDDDHARLEREAEKLIAEAEEALDRARDMFASFGLDEDDTRLSEFLSGGGPSEELDALRAEIFDGKDEQEALFAEEKRLRTEMGDVFGDPAPQPAPKPRRRMTRV
ncbi:MAG: hypothetical protein OXI88_02665 [Gammaproteobacteria bacterium]|nr:hypothetical protein [Gammaproteobacteria bacterium]MDE0282987.1 hypothetical protein [Gammaproteobacteria bacterium]MDE0510674.1 hypothetical protein [Gammaproteobacteria bacterium]